jgi:hypothetical protein
MNRGDYTGSIGMVRGDYILSIIDMVKNDYTGSIIGMARSDYESSIIAWLEATIYSV